MPLLVALSKPRLIVRIDLPRSTSPPAFHLCMPIEIGRPRDTRNHLSKTHRCGPAFRSARNWSRSRLDYPLITFLFARFIRFIVIDEYIVNVNFYPKNRVFYSIDQVSSFESRLSYFYSMNEINIDRWNATFTGISLYLTSELYYSLIKF